MKQILFTIFSGISFLNAVAQKTDSVYCPAIKLDGPQGNAIAEGNDAVISVHSFKKDFNKTHTISYEWNTINGVITDGKNRSTVHINTKGLLGEQIKAVVLVNGLDAGCPATATVTVDVVKPVVRIEQKIVVKRVN